MLKYQPNLVTLSMARTVVCLVMDGQNLMNIYLIGQKALHVKIHSQYK